jgi:antitoxin YefM
MKRNLFPALNTRRRGKPAVLMSMDEYSALQEITHLVRSPRNAARLREAREQVEKEMTATGPGTNN